MLFRCGEDGLVSCIRVESRGALAGGETVMMPWQGTFRDYRLQDGMMIPFHGEVARITPQGKRRYFRGTVRQVAWRSARQEIGTTRGRFELSRPRTAACAAPSGSANRPDRSADSRSRLSPTHRRMSSRVDLHQGPDTYSHEMQHARGSAGWETLTDGYRPL
jgi:hypothetical protein